MKTYSGLIKNLKSKQIFVFGSNTQGRHGAGASLFAVRNCGAEYGNFRGTQGHSYAIITKDLNKSLHPSIPKHIIIEQIEQLYHHAKDYAEYEFLIAYSGKGKNLNGYSNLEMAKMFTSAGKIPENIVFEETFAILVKTFITI